MSRFDDNLWGEIMDTHGEDLGRADAPTVARARRLRPRLYAGGTLSLAGIAAGIVLAVSGTAATTPAFAVTRQQDGTVLVKINYQTNQNLPEVNAKLAAMGTGEAITIFNAKGPAPVSGPVTCSAATGPGAPSGPTVKVLEGTDGTQVIKAGQSAGNTAEGTFHLVRCVTGNNTYSGNSGS